MGTIAADWLLREAGAEDFASVYLAILDDLQEHTRHAPASYSTFGDFRSRLEHAFAGDWEEHAAGLRQLGALYASAGASLLDWQESLAATNAVIHPLLIEKLAHEPERLVAALATMHAFFDRSFCVLSDSYFAASQAQLRRSELDLQKRERELKQWEALFEGVAFGICVLGRDGTAIEIANEAFMRIYGIESLFDQDDLVRVLAKIIPFAQLTGHGKYETKHIRQSTGEPFPVQVEAVRIPGRDGASVWGVSVHDLTDRKQVEALRARSRELELENRRVREGSRLKSEFLANMSHELRTPLNSILGFSELLHNGEVGELSEQQREFVGDIHTSGKHLLRLINDVLDLSKVEAGKMEFHAENADLAELVREVSAVLRGVSRDKNVKLEVEIAEEVREVHLDPSRLKQVLYNYLSNAIKFSDRDGQVWLRITPEGERHFRIEVSDRGCGVSPDDLKRLFREFEQLDPSRAKQHGGTGLGLALTRRLVEAQNGTVGVRSTLGEGSVFHAILPRRASVKPPPPSEPRLPALGGPSESAVLVIDDDMASTRLMAKKLDNLGVRVVVAHDGHDALARARESVPAAVVLDLDMPGLDGFGFLQRFRAEPAWQRVPVLIWSVLDLSSEQREQLQKSANAVFSKDGTSRLLDALRTHLFNPA